MAARLDIEVPRNGDYFARWTLRDRNTREPLDITGWTLTLSIASVAGAGSTVASATFSARDNPGGSFNIRIRGSDCAGVPGPMEIVRLAYDFVATDTTGVRVVETRGQIILMPGVS